MNPELFEALLANYPSKKEICDLGLFPNQCAIRMGVALEGAGVSTADFNVRRCATAYSAHPVLKTHKPGHILAAQELANALARNPMRLSTGVETKRFTGPMSSHWGTFGMYKGIVFIQNGWGPTDHIDLWDTTGFKGGQLSYIHAGVQVWFWRIA